MHPKVSAVDEKQRSPLLQFYLSALAFVGALILTEYSPSPWRQILYVAMLPRGLCRVGFASLP